MYREVCQDIPHEAFGDLLGGNTSDLLPGLLSLDCGCRHCGVLPCSSAMQYGQGITSVYL